VSASGELVGRAVRFLEGVHSATPAELAREVFGGESLAPLLSTLRHDRLVFDGARWSLREPSSELAILEVLASGPNPRRHRVVEVAAIYRGRTWAAQIAGDRPVPKLLRGLGVPEEGPDCVTLDEAGGQLRQFLAGATVAGFGYVPSYLDQLLGPGWPAIDLLRLLYATSELDGRPDPTRLAKRFGIPAPLNRRPRAMAGFSNALLTYLRGQRSIEELRCLAAPAAAAAPSLPRLPASPGVYVMSSPEDVPLYVGKSMDLSRRVPSYFGRPIAESRSLYQLAPMTARVDVVPVSSELEALLLEARLIEEWTPPFNIQRRARERCLYLRLSAQEPFPRLTERPSPEADGATYFGPFRHATAARRLRLLLASILRLRTCTRRLPAGGRPRPPCSKAATGGCLAPCIVGPPPSSYDAEVALPRALLAAPPEDFRHQLRRLLRERPPAPGTAQKLKRQLEALAAGTRPDGDELRKTGGEPSPLPSPRRRGDTSPLLGRELP
jgi:hypothetical protein